MMETVCVSIYTSVIYMSYVWNNPVSRGYSSCSLEERSLLDFSIWLKGSSPCWRQPAHLRVRHISFDTVWFNYIIGYSYLENSDMMKKSSEASWLADEVHIRDCDWKLRYLRGLCGLGWCTDKLDRSSGKITALFIKAHLTEEGHLCPS